MRKMLSVFLILVCLFPLSAQLPENDGIVAVAAVTDAAIASLAGFVATPRYRLPGCALSVSQGGTLPDALTFSESDLGGYLAVIPAENKDSAWYEKLLSQAKGPLDGMARLYFTVHDWQEGEAILDGTIVPHFPEDMTLAGIIASVATGKEISPIRTTVDVKVRGKRVSVPVDVSGTIAIGYTKEGGVSIDGASLVVDKAESPSYNPVFSTCLVRKPLQFNTMQ